MINLFRKKQLELFGYDTQKPNSIYTTKDIFKTPEGNLKGCVIINKTKDPVSEDVIEYVQKSAAAVIGFTPYIQSPDFTPPELSPLEELMIFDLSEVGLYNIASGNEDELFSLYSEPREFIEVTVGKLKTDVRTSLKLCDEDQPILDRYLSNLQGSISGKLLLKKHKLPNIKKVFKEISENYEPIKEQLMKVVVKSLYDCGLKKVVKDIPFRKDLDELEYISLELYKANLFNISQRDNLNKKLLYLESEVALEKILSEDSN